MKLWRVWANSAVMSMRVSNQSGLVGVSGAEFLVEQGNYLLTTSMITQAGGLEAGTQVDFVTARADHYAQMTREWD